MKLLGEAAPSEKAILVCDDQNLIHPFTSRLFEANVQKRARNSLSARGRLNRQRANLC